MKKRSSLMLVACMVICISLSSCAALRTLDMTKLSIGMDKETVIATLKAKPGKVIGVKSYRNGTVEVLQYFTDPGSTDKAAFSWLYFYNNKLVQYGMPDRDHDWQFTADNIAAMKGGE